MVLGDLFLLLHYFTRPLPYHHISTRPYSFLPVHITNRTGSSIHTDQCIHPNTSHTHETHNSERAHYVYNQKRTAPTATRAIPAIPVEPHKDATKHHGGHEDKPEPDEDEDLLVEEVDGEDTLHGVAVDVAELTHVEVTQRDAREAF